MRALRVLKVLLIVVVACVVMSYIVMRLWNWLMPEIFGLHAVTYAQAFGLLILSKILLGGFHKHGGHGGWKKRAWRKQMDKRWAKMTPEERDRFRAGMRARWNCRMPGRDEVSAEPTAR
jgi:hypothetical protein